ncbi:MAG TPA: class I SAM-dependent methyltransferase [Acidimicrobiales bacterium]|nr:class I SAM-dependent methyltransferase [Acidimicrobiales bacterium]
MTPPGRPARDEVPAAVLGAQVEYYRARAAEYDDWFFRRGRYDRGAAATAAWRAELVDARAALTAVGLAGRDVLELAPGTGLWTEALLAEGASVTAVDAAPEMLDALVRRCGGPGLVTVRTDLFAWRPPRHFDAVVACFFLSHVPDERLDGFLELVAAALGDDGRLFLLDSLREATSTARDHVLTGSARCQTTERRLDDGRTYEIVKVFRSDDELVAACARAGLCVEVRRTATYFQIVTGRRRPTGPPPTD